MKRPKHYKPVQGDQFVRLDAIRPEHKGRVFEARDQRSGEGIVGYLSDAEHYMLAGVVGIRFHGQREGIFDRPEALILLHPEGYTHPDLVPLADPTQPL